MRKRRRDAPTGITSSISFYHHFDRADGRTSNVRPPMKRKKKAILVTAVIMLGTVIAAGFVFFSMPLVWYDRQGFNLVTILESKFDLPIEEGESREAIYHTGYAFLTLKGWKLGSKVFVYGVESQSLQDRLLEQAAILISDQRMNDVVFEFHPKRMVVTTGDWSQVKETKP